MTYTRVRKLVNPRRAKAKSRPKKKTWRPSHKLARRADGTFMRRRVSKPKRKATARPKPAQPRRVAVRPTRNPALVLTLGANPKKRRSVVAKARKRKKAVTAHRKTHRRRTNPATRVVVVAPRAHNRRRSTKASGRKNYRRRRYAVNRRRNPDLFGTNVNATTMATAIAGGLLGVTVTKIIVGKLPSSIVGIGGSWGKVLASGVAAFVAGMLTKKLVKGVLGDAVLFGGLMQTGSVAINALSPSIGAQFGLGEFVNAQFPVPQNPVQRPAAVVPTNVRVQSDGLARAFGRAF